MALPSLPERFVPRPELLAAARSVVVDTAPVQAVGLVGMGGAGKSTLARALLADRAVGEAFPDGLLWVEVGPDPDLVSGQARVAAALGDLDPITDVAAGRDRLRRLLTGGRRLIVLDNVWGAEVLRAFDVGLPTVRILVTSRGRDVLLDDAPMVLVGAVDDEQGRAVIAGYAGLAPADLPPEADDVRVRCGGLVLALAMAGGMVADGAAWSDVAARLARADLAALTTRFAGYPYPDLLRALDAGVEALPDRQRDRYLELAVFEGRGPVPPEAVARLWRATAGLDEGAGKELMHRLARRSLVQLDPDGGALTVHDLVFDHMRASLEPGRLDGLHARFAAAFLTDWGGLARGLPALRDRDVIGQPDRYALGELAAHLVAAGLDDELHALLAAQWPGPDGTAENAWFSLHERADLPGAYLADVRHAWKRAAAPAPAAPAPAASAPAASAAALVRPLRYALILSSVVSRADNLPRGLLRRLLEAEVWPVDRALAYARSRLAATERAATLAVVVPFLPPPRRGGVVDEAWDAVAADVDHHKRVTALAGIADLLPTERWSGLADQAVDDGLAIADPHDRADHLARLAPHLPPDQQARAAAAALAALTTVDDTFHRAWTLRALAAALPAEHLPTALEIALAIDQPFHRAQALADLADHLPAHLVPDAWDALSEIPGWSERARALVALARHRPAAERVAAVGQAWEASRHGDSYRRVPTMAVLAPHQPVDVRDAAIVEAWRAAREQPADAHEPELGQAIAALAPHLPPDLLAEAVEAGASIQWGQFRAEALTGLAPYLTGTLPDLALAAVGALDGPGDRRRAVVGLVPRLPVRLLPRALAITRTVDPPMHRARALTEFATHLPAGPPGGPHATVVAAALTAAAAVGAPTDRAIALSKLAPQLDPASLDPASLDPASLDRALAVASAIDEPVARVQAWAGLLAHLPAQRRPAVLREAWDIGQRVTGSSGQATVLAGLAPHLPDELVSSAVAAAIAINDPFPRVEALVALAERLPARDRRAALLPLLPSLDAPRDVYLRARLLAAVAPVLTDVERHERFTAVLDVLAATGHPMRVVTMEKLGPGLPADLFGRAIELSATIDHRYGPAQALAGLVPYLPDALVPVALDAVLSLAHPPTRGRAIAAIAARLPVALVRRAFDAALAIDSPSGRSEALTGLAPHLPVDLLPAAADAAGELRGTDWPGPAMAVAWAARGLPGADWDRFSALTLADVARSDRATVIGYLPTMLARLPAGAAADAAERTVAALTDVLRWWP